MTDDMERRGFLGLIGLGFLGAQTVSGEAPSKSAKDPEIVSEQELLARFREMVKQWGWIGPEEIRRLERLAP